jgi:sugar lactone lactonase YvrE
MATFQDFDLESFLSVNNFFIGLNKEETSEFKIDIKDLIEFIRDQNLCIYTLAGKKQKEWSSTSSGGYVDGSVDVARFSNPRSIAVDSLGNIYIADTGNHRIRKISVNGDVSTLAGSGSAGFADGDGISASFNNPTDIAIDDYGNLYIADSGNHKIRKISQSGFVTTIAGSSSGFAEGDGLTAKFSFPTAIALDSVGNIYVADSSNYRIRKIVINGAIVNVTTFAGSGLSGSVDGDAASAKFNYVTSLKIDSYDSIYIADPYNHKIRKITNSAGQVIVSTLAGSSFGYVDGEVLLAKFNQPKIIALGSNGDVFVFDSGNRRIRKIDSSGKVSTFAGVTNNSSVILEGSTKAASIFTSSSSTFASAGGLAFDFTKKRILFSDCSLHSIFGISQCVTAPASVNYELSGPRYIAVDNNDNFYVTEQNSHCIKKITPAGNVSIWAGSVSEVGSQDGQRLNARFNFPAGMIFDSENNMYVCDSKNHTIRKISQSGEVSTLLGSVGSPGFLDGNLLNTKFNTPIDLCINSGRLYILDKGNYRIRRSELNGTGVLSVAGNGTRGNQNSPDGYTAGTTILGDLSYIISMKTCYGNRMIFGSGTSGFGLKFLSQPVNVNPSIANGACVVWTWASGASASQGLNGFIEDNCDVIYSTNTGLVRSPYGQYIYLPSVVAGKPGPMPFYNDAAVAGCINQTFANSLFSNIGGIIRDSSRNIYLCDAKNNMIRKLDISTGNVSIFC